MMTLEQHRAQGRGERQGVECGDDGGDGDGDGELFVKLAGQPADEGGGNEHRAQHQRGGDNRAGDFAHGPAGGFKRGQPQGDVALDVFNHHNRVIHDDPDGQHQPEERKRIDAEAQGQHHAEGADERHRHCGQWNNGRTPGLEKQDHHQHDQQDRLGQRVNDGLDGMPHKHGRIIDHGIIHALREVFLQFLHLGADIGGQLQGVGPGGLENRDGHRRLVVQQRTERVAARAQLDAGHVLEQGFRAVRPGLDDDLAEFLLRNQPALHVDGHFEVHGVFDWLLPHHPGGDLHVLLADGVDNVAGGQVSRRDFVRVQPEAHGVIARAENLHVAGAGNAGQHVLDLEGGVVAQINVVIPSIRGKEVDHHRQVRRLLGGGDAQRAHFLGQFGQGLGHPVLDLHLGLVHVGAELEGDGGGQHAVAGRLREDI